jgi:Domain of unknown function (DUF4399)
MKPVRVLLCSLLALGLFPLACASALAQSVQFVQPADGAVLISPFKVAFGVSGMRVAPAGDMTPGTGHHHLLINVGPIPEGQVIPMDDAHRHYGKG